MLPRNWQQQGQNPHAEPLRMPPALSARLRLFALLGVIGPLFAGLHSLVLDVTPTVETTVLISDAASPTPDVVVVETVVERVVYVPIDSLPAAAPTHSAEAVAVGARPDAGGGAMTEVARDSTQSEQAAVEDEAAASAQVAAAAAAAVPRVAPPSWAAPVHRVPPAESVADEPEQSAEDGEADTEAGDAAQPAAASDDGAAPEDEQHVAETPRVVVVHTLMWDGEQFSAVTGEPVEQYVIEGAREAIAEKPHDVIDNAPATATADGTAPADGKPEGHQVTNDEESIVAEGDGAHAAADEEAAAQPDSGAAIVKGEEPEGEALNAEPVAESEPQETDELIVKANETEPAADGINAAVADTEPGDEPTSEGAQAADQPEDAEQPVSENSDHSAVIEAIEHAAAEGAAAIEAVPEIPAEDSEEVADPAATPTVGRNPAGEAVEIVLPSN